MALFQWMVVSCLCLSVDHAHEGKSRLYAWGINTGGWGGIDLCLHHQPLPSCVSTTNPFLAAWLLDFSEPRFPHLKNGNNNISPLMGLGEDSMRE